MPIKNIYDKPFDEGTITKLEIFENYLKSWLPVFLKSSFIKPIQIFDLFAGQGLDINGMEGSPLRALKVINEYRNNLSANKKVHLFFNDEDINKINNLKQICNDKITEYDLKNFIEINFSSLSFKNFLNVYKVKIECGCNLIFVDQNGFKHVNEKVFQYLINIDTTEFIFFISSNYLRRFADDPKVQIYHPKFDFQKIKNCNRKEVHNIIRDEYEKYVPDSIKSYSLIPFSIMKSNRNNVYGLIFVSKHILGADKFLRVVWKMNGLNGNANFDIDDDSKKCQLNIFSEKSLTKIESFQKKLEELILLEQLSDNQNVYIYTLNQGHIPKHASEKIVNMKKNKLISYDERTPLVNYNKAIKENRKINFKVLKKNEAIENRMD